VSVTLGRNPAEGKNTQGKRMVGGWRYATVGNRPPLGKKGKEKGNRSIPRALKTTVIRGKTPRPPALQGRKVNAPSRKKKRKTNLSFHTAKTVFFWKKGNPCLWGFVEGKKTAKKPPQEWC